MSSQPSRLADPPGLARARRSSAGSRWIDARFNDAALAMAALSDRVRRRRRFVCVEQANGAFARVAADGRVGASFVFEDKGFPAGPNWRRAQVEFRLLPQRCVFREVELPAQAADFLGGVVSAQIDRLTPWRLNETAFGWSKPEPREGRRIAVWVAAAKRAPIVELAEAAGSAGADAVSVTATRDAFVPIEIYAQRGGAALRIGRWRLTLTTLLFGAMAAAFAAAVAQYTVGANFAERSDALASTIATKRAALLTRDHEGDDLPTQALAAKKRGAVSAVIALEALSRALPDQAYLTEMRLEGEKLEIAGVAANAADLIPALESSPHFSQATFTAPTIRADKGEVFRIEVRVAPLPKVLP